MVSSSRFAAATECEVCGGTTTFNWELAKDQSPEQDAERRRYDLPGQSAFEFTRPLRRGALYACKTCFRSWYLHSADKMISQVSADRVSLILEWNKHAIVLPQEIKAKLTSIGDTPHDIYGNGRQYHQTPCGVITRSGERIDLAIVCLQEYAPYEDWRQCRLGSEIADVYPSPHALPLSVRVATTKAEEIRMGFSPTLIEMPNDRFLILNGTCNFLLDKGFRADEARIPRRRPAQGRNAQLASAADQGITYFIADE